MAVRSWIVGISVLVLLFASGGVWVHHNAPVWLNRCAREKLRESCPQCKLEIGSMSLSWLSGRVVVHDLRFSNSPEAGTGLTIEVPRIEASISIGSIIAGDPLLRRAVFYRPDVLIHEGSDRPDSLPSGAPYPEIGVPVKGLPDARIGELKVEEGFLTYENMGKSGLARIQLSDIDARAGSFTTRDRGKPDVIEAVATARLEHSGHVRMEVRFDPFDKTNHDKVDIRVRDQDLAKVNPFFIIDQGVELKGHLQEAHADLSISRGHLSGTLRARYDDVDVDFKSTPDRSPLASDISNLLIGLKMTATRPKDEHDDPAAEVVAQRKPHQPVTKLLIEGLKESVKKILTS